MDLVAYEIWLMFLGEKMRAAARAFPKILVVMESALTMLSNAAPAGCLEGHEKEEAGSFDTTTTSREKPACARAGDNRSGLFRSGFSVAGSGVMSLPDRGTLPVTGILIDKINFKTTCGASMPQGNPQKLPATDLDCLQAWANGLAAAASVGS